MSVPWSTLLYAGRAASPPVAHRPATWSGRAALACKMPGALRQGGHLAIVVALILLATLRFAPASPTASSHALTASSVDARHQGILASSASSEGYVGPVARTWTSRGIRAVLPAPATDLGGRLVPVGYVVQEGDSLASIAARFGLVPQTILGANATLGGSANALRPGLEILILPVDGVYYEAAEGDTLERIASRFGVAVEAIRSFPANGLRDDDALAAGQRLVIPGATAAKYTSVAASTGPPPFLPDASVPSGAGGTGALHWPMAGVFSQGYSAYHQAIDIAASVGTPVLAADAGYVALVGPYHAQYGNMIVLNHGGGRQTLYAHLQGYAVELGQVVAAQQVIAYCGSTGNSTGPHLHLEVYEEGVRQNPMGYLP